MTNLDLLQTRLYVQGGMDSVWTDADTRDARVQFILEGGGHPAMESLTAAERAGLAVAFLRGWVTHHLDSEPPPPLTWHRLLGGSVVQVSTS